MGVLPIPPALASVGALASILRRYAAELPTDELPALVAELEAAKAAAWVRLATPAPNPPAASDTRLLDAKAMAERLQVPESWLREHARQGRIPSVHLGHYVRFNPTIVMKALEDQAGKGGGGECVN